MTSDIRKLMETMAKIHLSEGWDPEAIAQAIYNDVKEGGSALELAAQRSPEPYRAMVYEFGNLSGLYNAESLDGSEIWKRIIDKLEELFGDELQEDEESFNNCGVCGAEFNWTDTGNPDDEMCPSCIEDYELLADDADPDMQDDPNRPGWQDEHGKWHKYEKCATCKGWGEIIPPGDEQDVDNRVPCPDCGPGSEKSLSMGEGEEVWEDYEIFEEKCEKCGREGCTCGPDCDCKPVKESGERPYICVHAKKGKHECHADSSYGAAKKAAEHWGLKSTAGIDAHLADVSHSTQFVGEDNDEKSENDARAPTREELKMAKNILKRMGYKISSIGVETETGRIRVTDSWAPDEPKFIISPKGKILSVKRAKDDDTLSFESISLGSIVESVLSEDGQPVDYELPDDELDVSDEVDFERDKIDPEIEDEELGMRFD